MEKIEDFIGKTPAYEWMGKPEKITDFVSESTYDIVVIGAGIAGCAAAQAAAEQGAKVICVEKFATFTAHGTDVCGVGTKLQKAQGISFDKVTAARLIYQWGQSLTNYALIRYFVEHSGEVMDYYIDMAEKNKVMVTINNHMTARADWDGLEDRFKIFRSPHNFAPMEGCKYPVVRWKVTTLINMIKDSAEELGATFAFNTPAKQLVREGNRITGVIVQDAEGYKLIHATKGVIMASGGISDNKKMIETWCPYVMRADRTEHFPAGANMGDGLIMGVWAGAAVTRCNPYPVIHPVNLSPMGPGITTSWPIFNKFGKRFCCEVSWEPIVTNARMQAPGNVAWTVWDKNYKARALQQEPMRGHEITDGVEEEVEETVRKGIYYKSDTLEGLAEQLGMPADAFVASVERYNNWCDKGFDEDFGVPARFLMPIKEGPFYASNVSAWMLNVGHGLHVDANSQVCGEDDEPIGGLFAVGNMQGDFMSNSYPVTLPGLNHGRSLVFARKVGQALANDTVINGDQYN